MCFFCNPDGYIPDRQGRRERTWFTGDYCEVHVGADEKNRIYLKAMGEGNTYRRYYPPFCPMCGRDMELELNEDEWGAFRLGCGY